MNGRKPDKAEQVWLDGIRQIGCICCIADGYIQPYEVSQEHTAIHHIDGQRKAGAHFKTLPLCPNHHQHGPVSVHGTKRQFKEEYGTEQFLLDWVGELYATSSQD